MEPFAEGTVRFHGLFCMNLIPAHTSLCLTPNVNSGPSKLWAKLWSMNLDDQVTL